MEDTDHNKRVMDSIETGVVEYGECISGNVYGSLTVLQPHSRDSKRCLKYLCECSCGKLTTPYKHQLVKGRVKSCGCANKSVRIGDKFGRLTVVSESDKKLSYCRSAVMTCICSCGNTLDVRSLSLVQGNTKSCGCLAEELIQTLNKSHGDSATSFYKVWSGMKARCLNPANKGFEDYGGRGINIDPRWNDYENFKTDMYIGYSVGLVLDRADNDGNYCKENCRWVSENVSVWNRRKSKNNTSGRTGVVWHQESNKWRAQISVGSKPNNKMIHLGCFDLFEDAVKARELAELLYRGEIKNYE